MLKSLSHIFWLGTKELRAVLNDATMVALIIFVFTGMVYMQATAISDNVNNASIAVVDEDNSALSRQISNAFYPPFFQVPQQISHDALDDGLHQNRFLFALVIPDAFESDLRRGARPEVQLHIDATAVLQAGLGDGYIQSIISDEVNRYLARSDADTERPIRFVSHRAFNPNGYQSWFNAMTGVLDFLTMVSILLAGAALIREREHGTIEHLLVMPLTAFEIAAAKVWANGVIILVAFSLSMVVVVEGVLNVPVAGSRGLVLFGAGLYLFATSAIGIFLGIVARTMAQFALLVLMMIMPMMMLSGGISPIESQPDIVQPFTLLLPSRHFMAFAQAVMFRGAGLEVIWPQLLAMSGLGLVFLAGSLRLFRRSIGAGG